MDKTLSKLDIGPRSALILISKGNVTGTPYQPRLRQRILRSARHKVNQAQLVVLTLEGFCRFLVHMYMVGLLLLKIKMTSHLHLIMVSLRSCLESLVLYFNLHFVPVPPTSLCIRTNLM